MTSISWVFVNFTPQTWRKAPRVVICSLRSTLVWLPHCQPTRINWNHALRGVAWYGLGCTCEKNVSGCGKIQRAQGLCTFLKRRFSHSFDTSYVSFFFQMCYFVSGARDSWCLTHFIFPAGLIRCLQFKLVSDGSAIPSTGIFPFPLQNGQVPEKKRVRFGWWFGGQIADRGRSQIYKPNMCPFFSSKRFGLP